jgi:hypothetical protein
MISDRLLPDRVTIFKASGEKYSDIRASIQKKIYINQTDLPIEDGDTVEQVMPSGVIKKFVITDVYIASGLRGPNHVEISYEKVS